MTRRQLRWGALAAVATSLVAVVALFITWQPNHLTEFDRAEPVESANLTGAGPGSLVSAMTMPAVSRQLPSGMHAARIVYRSTEGDTGLPTSVSGSAFVPSGIPPDGGWSIIALGHGTTGINEPCAPSLTPDLSGLISVVANLLQSGYAVVIPDYQGLGAAGIHPYLDSRTAGYNVIDAVRAARATFPHLSGRWAAAGWSQGGAAVWAADEYAAIYGSELELVGAVAVAPPTNVSGIVDHAQDGSLTADQVLPFIWVLTSLNRLHPDFKLEDYRRGVVAQYWDQLAACSGPEQSVADAVARDFQPADLSPSDSVAADRLRTLLEDWALPQRPLVAPLFVLYGDDDPYIDPQWTKNAIARACSWKGTVVWRLEQGKGHEDLDLGGQAQWVADRFAGKPLINQCPS